MFVQEVTSRMQLFLVQHGDELHVLHSPIVCAPHSLGISPRLVESLPCAESGAHGRAYEEIGLLSEHHAECFVPLGLAAEVPGLAVVGI